MTPRGRPRERARLADDQRSAALEYTKQLLERFAVTRNDVCRITGLNRSTVDRWFQRKGTQPTHGNVRAICNYLSRVGATSKDVAQLHRVWGFAAPGSLTFHDVKRKLAECDFSGVGADEPPDRVLWLHKLRAPNIVHGVLTLAAAAMLRADVEVVLLLDDYEVTHADALRQQFVRAVTAWCEWAQAPAERLQVLGYTKILTDERVAATMNTAISRYLGGPTTVNDLLAAAKLLLPRPGRDDDVAGRVKRALDSPAAALRTPILNWMVADHQAERTTSDSGEASLATLGGADELDMWLTWKSRTATPHRDVRNIYIDVFPEPVMTSDNRPTDRELFRERSFADLVKSGEDADDKARWVRTFAVALPAALNDDFRAATPLDLLDGAAFKQAWRTDRDRVARELATAVKQWFA